MKLDHADLFDRVEREVQACSVVDLHTHLFPPEFGELCLSGPDELLTYHYLIAETLRFTLDRPEEFLARPKKDQADVIWKTLFVDQTPISEAASGVAATFVALGLDPSQKDLREAREYAKRPIEQRIEEVFELAGIECVTMTNDPLNEEEKPIYENGFRGDSRFRTALRIDPVLLQERGVHAWIADYILEWAEKLNASYVAASLPPDLDLAGDSPEALRLRNAVLPTLQRLKLPLALMIGVRRGVNPKLKMAGDGSGVADLSGLGQLLAEFPDVRFLVTTLARENTQELCVLARKFANLTPFGCWWFMNNPSLIQETTTMRLEMLGTSFVPQHSDARILEQLIYKWGHSRRFIASSLQGRYKCFVEDGITLRDSAIEADVHALLRGNALEFLK